MATQPDSAQQGPGHLQPAALLERCVPLVRRLSFLVARQYRMTRDEAEELQSLVLLKLIENDYGVLRSFRGDSTIATFLAVVMRRTALDVRTAALGKWRPTASVRRAGPTAVALDRLMAMRGVSFDAACQIYCSAGGQPVTPDDQRRLRQVVQPRARRRFVDLEGASELSCPAEQEVLAQHRSAAAVTARTARIIRTAMAALPASDRRLLKWRFLQGRNVADIARDFALDQKRLYRRFERILAGLRARLESAGVSRPIAMSALSSHLSQQGSEREGI